MIPGEASRLRLASTAHGPDRVDRARDVLRAEAAGEEDAALRGAARSQWAVVLLEPGEVEHKRATSSPAKESAVASAVAVFLRVELLEVGADVLGLADEDADREHRVRDRKRRVGSTRALGEDEARKVGARLGRDRDVLLARQAANLDERPAQKLGELRGRDPVRA